MSNKYMKEVQGLEIRKQLPALQGLNIDAHIPKARASFTGSVGQSLGKMLFDMAEFKIKLNKTETERSFRELEIQTTEQMTALPAGWEGTPDGISQYNDILSGKINRQKEILEERKGGVGVEFYKEYQTRIAEQGAKNLVQVDSMTKQYELKELTFRAASAAGNMKSDMLGALASITQKNVSLNLPPDA
ncbi:MAG: hypothetical protein ACRC45_00645, partial [Cetobacterium sp.]